MIATRKAAAPKVPVQVMMGTPILADAPGSIAPAMADPSGLGGPMPDLQKRGIFDRIGDFLKSDEGRGALLRSGAATLQGGLGAGIEAGANWADKRHAQAAEQGRFDTETGLKKQDLGIRQQQADQTGDYQQGQLELGAVDKANDQARIKVEAQRARMDAFLKQQGIQVDWAKLDQQERDSKRGYDASIYSTSSTNMRHGVVSANERYSQEQQNYRHDNPAPAGIGSKSATIQEKRPAIPASDGWFSSTPGQPERVTQTNVMSMPRDPAQLVPGQIYQTVKGPARFNGHQMVPLD